MSVLGLMLLMIGATGASAETTVWTSIGPFGGGARALAIDPRNSRTVYAGTTGGVFKTIDGGTRWIPANRGLPAGYIARCLAIDPQNPDTIYTGGSGDSGWGWNDRIFKSTDGGATWKGASSGLEDVIFVESLAIDPRNSGTVYAGTSACVLGACHNAAVFKTTDGGANWSPTGAGLPWAAQAFASVGALAVDPQDSSTLYAGTGGLFKSTDGGTSWNQIRASSVAALAIDPRNPATLYVADRGVSKTTDGGVSWTTSNIGLPAANCCGSLALDAQNPNTLYVGSPFGGVYKSEDGGHSWTDTGLQNPSAGLAVDPQNPGTIYAATPGRGVFKSTDGAQSWRAMSDGLSATSVTTVAIDTRNVGRIYAATGDGVIKTRDGGASWSVEDSDLRAASIRAFGAPTAPRSLAIDSQDSETIYAGLARLGIFKSTDGGAKWNAINSGLDVRNFSGLVAVDPRNSGALFAGDFSGSGPGFTADLYKSADGGTSWRSSGSFGNSITALAIDSQSPGTVYVGAVWSIYKTTDGGAGWSEIRVPLPDYDCAECTPVSALAVDPRDSNTVYAGGYLGVLKSLDGGTSWTAMNSGLSAWTDWAGVVGLVIDPRDTKNLFATIGGKVFKSTDGAASWSEVVSGLTVTSVRSLAIDPRTSTVYAVSEGGGIFAIVAP